MKPEALAKASKVLALLAERLKEPPDPDGRVRVPIDEANHVHTFGALQHLLKGTEWEGHFCWEFNRSGRAWPPTVLSVDVRPQPTKIRCQACNGKGEIEVLRTP